MADCTSGASESQKERDVIELGVVALGQHRGDLDDYGAIMEIMYGGSGTPLSAVRPCGMGVIPSKALDMYGSPHLIIPYLLRCEQGDLEDKSQDWIGDIGG